MKTPAHDAGGVALPPALRPDWFDPEQLTRLASELEELNLRLHGGEHDKFRPGIVCAAALLRAVTHGLAPQSPPMEEKESLERAIAERRGGKV